MGKFEAICKKIKNLEIQGAESVARKGVEALFLPGADEEKLLNLRPTEPLLFNAVKYAKRNGLKKTLKHFDDAKKKIIELAYPKIKSVVFTHCHSSTVVDALIDAKKKGKKFKVYNTETRPLYQGRKTAKELSKAKIHVTNVVDAAVGVALEKAKVVMMGCDAILTNKKGNITGIVNKIGSGIYAELAKRRNIPVYILGNSWKIAPKHIDIEERQLDEVWKRAPKGVKLKNPAFEIIDVKNVTGIISELGVLSPKKFVKKVNKKYPWIFDGFEKKLILFDMDNTLIDADKMHIHAFNKAFVKYGLERVEARKLKPLFGMPGYKIVKVLFPKLSISKCKEVTDLHHNFLMRESKKYVKAFKGVKNTLRYLKKRFRLGIVSNIRHSEILTLLKSVGIDRNLFDVFVGADEVKKPKPAPNEVFKAEKILKDDADYLVGDTIYDIITGRKSNTKVIAVLTGNQSRKMLAKEEPFMILKSVNDLKKIASKL